jgi:hypothetical protein
MKPYLRKRALVACGAILIIGLILSAVTFVSVRRDMQQLAKQSFATEYAPYVDKFELFFHETKLALRSVADAISGATSSLPPADMFLRVSGRYC